MGAAVKDQNKHGNLGITPVSVIIPCYRCADTIRRAVDSVLAQTLPAYEIILVDDCSNDGKTLDVLEQLRRRYPDENIRVLGLEKNSGPGSARNAGWDAATQPYLAFLDADDSWHPEKLEIQYQWMAAHPDVVLTGHPSVILADGMTLPKLPDDVVAKRVRINGLLISNLFPTRSVMLKREVSYRFIPGKRYAEDYLLWLTIVLSGRAAWVLEIPMAYSFKEAFGDGGLTGNLWKSEQGELDTYKRLFLARKISFFALILCSSFSLLKYVRRWGIAKARALSGNLF
ncbi:putative teichuronic acid biosynthesis glycosyltransferase TuaG [mine drainage metagenome]|uniref:Putative teichuronic acid biosynthesis glycosyltransferase TuaG n=1 Tax=mine drainage metagenome TaxID=410659 RepID=A0A1J5R1G8_9ZZZZ